MTGPAPDARIRAFCATLPETTEKEAWGDATFRVKDRIFAMMRQGERPSVWMKAEQGTQAMLVEIDPERFYRPPYVGHRGWIGIWLDGGVDWDEVCSYVRRSYRLTAPKRLVARLDAAAG